MAEKIGIIKKAINWWVSQYNSDSSVSSTRIVFVNGIFITLLAGFTLSFVVVVISIYDKEKLGYIAPILGAIFGGMVAIITALAAVKGYQSKQENQIAPKEDESKE